MKKHYIRNDLACTNNHCDQLLMSGEAVTLFSNELFCSEECVIFYYSDGMGFEEVELTNDKKYAESDY